MPSVRPAGPPTLGVSLLPYAAFTGQDPQADVERTAAMTRALKEVLGRHPQWRVVLFEFFSGSPEYGDARMLRALQEQLALGERVSYRPYSGDFSAIYASLAACDAFVGMRFHACLLAHMAGVPCLMLAYHPKSESLAVRLRLSPDAIVPLPILQDPLALAPRIEALLTENAKFRSSVSLDILRTESARNFTLMSSWLASNDGQVAQESSA
jgi:polysaccharide pyruvyl transferase WcaK-like protein